MASTDDLRRPLASTPDNLLTTAAQIGGMTRADLIHRLAFPTSPYATGMAGKSSLYWAAQRLARAARGVHFATQGADLARAGDDLLAAHRPAVDALVAEYVAWYRAEHPGYFTEQNAS